MAQLRLVCVWVSLAAMNVGCGGYTGRTRPMRTALDAGDPRDAIAASTTS